MTFFCKAIMSQASGVRTIMLDGGATAVNLRRCR